MVLVSGICLSLTIFSGDRQYEAPIQYEELFYDIPKSISCIRLREVVCRKLEPVEQMVVVVEFHYILPSNLPVALHQAQNLTESRRKSEA